jgi:hypothetical protein
MTPELTRALEGAAGAILGLLVFQTALVRRARRKNPTVTFWDLVVTSEDNKYSLSRLQFYLWTVAIVVSYVALCAAAKRRCGIPESLYLLMGVNAASAVTSTAITVSQDLVPKSTKADKPNFVADIFLDSMRSLDLPRTQMFVWTVLTLGGYLLAVAHRIDGTYLKSPGPDEGAILVGRAKGVQDDDTLLRRVTFVPGDVRHQGDGVDVDGSAELRGQFFLPLRKMGNGDVLFLVVRPKVPHVSRLGVLAFIVGVVCTGIAVACIAYGRRWGERLAGHEAAGAVINALQVGVLLENENGVVVGANQRAEEILKRRLPRFGEIQIGEPTSVQADGLLEDMIVAADTTGRPQGVAARYAEVIPGLRAAGDPSMYYGRPRKGKGWVRVSGSPLPKEQQRGTGVPTVAVVEPLWGVTVGELDGLYHRHTGEA